MNENQEKPSEEEKPLVNKLDEDFFDFLATVAMEYEDFLEAEEIMDACNLSPESRQERAAARRAYKRAMSASKQEQREQTEQQQQQQQAPATGKSFHIKPTKLLAYMLMFMVLTIPVAMASVPEVCTRMMNLVVDMDEEEQAIGIAMSSNQSIASYIPKEWTGKYFPRHIPNDLKLLSCSSFFDSSEVRYANEDGEITVFTEYGSDFEISSGSENSSISYLYLDNFQIFKTMSLDQQYIKLIWAIENRWFVIESYSLSQEDLLSIVKSVRQVLT